MMHSGLAVLGWSQDSPSQQATGDRGSAPGLSKKSDISHNVRYLHQGMWMRHHTESYGLHCEMAHPEVNVQSSFDTTLRIRLKTVGPSEIPESSISRQAKAYSIAKKDNRMQR